MKIKLPQTLRLNSLLYNKKFTVTLSIILAFSLWLGIAMIEKPIREKTFTDLNLSVSLEGTSAEKMGLTIFSDVSSQKFSVTVSGPNYLVSELEADDILLSVPTDDINSAYEYTLDVTAKTNVNDSELKIKSVSPASVILNVDYNDKVDFNYQPDKEDNKYFVELNNINVNPEDGYMLGDVIIPDTHKTLTIEGPRKIIEKIGRVSAFLDVNQTLSESKAFDTDVVLYGSNESVLYRFTPDGTVYDGNNNVILNSYLKMSFTSVKVTQEILQQKEVACKAKFANLPSGLSADDISYRLDKSKVIIVGLPEIVDKITEISNEPISFKEISPSSNRFKKPFDLPDGITVLGEDKELNITVDTSKYLETTLTVKNVKYTGLDEGLKASSSNQSFSIKVCGPRDVIRKLKANDITVLANLEGKTAGTHNVELSIKSDKYDKIWLVGSQTVKVEIK